MRKTAESSLRFEWFWGDSHPHPHLWQDTRAKEFDPLAVVEHVE